MSEEILRIRRMIADGKVTPEEGAELIASVEVKPPAPPPVVAAAPIRRFWILWPLLSHGVCFLAIYAVLVVAAPKFVAIFKSLDAPLPLMTLVVIAASHLAQQWALLILPASALALVLDALLYAFLRRHGWHVVAALWWWALTLFALFAAAIIILSLWLPLLNLMHSVAAQAGH